MAKVKHQTGRTTTTKTPYGSTSDMIVIDDNIRKLFNIHPDCELLQDDDGYYITHKSRVDSGLADPLRYCQPYRKSMNYEHSHLQ